MLEQANPRVGSTIKGSPQRITLTFTQKLEGAFSSISVTNASGARVDAGKAQVDASNPTVLQVGVKSLAAGTYKVQWKVLSVDTHTTQGSFSFTVAP